MTKSWKPLDIWIIYNCLPLFDNLQWFHIVNIPHSTIPEHSHLADKSHVGYVATTNFVFITQIVQYIVQ